jgi:hypothetical protein
MSWKTGKPPIEEPILAVVETNKKTRYYLGVVTPEGDLVDLEYGDDHGWEAESIDRWCTISDLDELLEERSTE